MGGDGASRSVGTRTRREPPPMRLARVTAKEELSPRMLRVTLEGDGLRQLGDVDTAASIRLLIPSPGADALVIPTWDGNVWLLPGGERAVVRTFTPLRVDLTVGRLDLEIVRHGGGAVSGWTERVEVGAEVAVSGPARGYTIDAAASRFVLFGDETALPAIAQLLEALPVAVSVEVHVEAVSEDAVLPLPEHPGLVVSWHVRATNDRPGAALVRAAAVVEPVEPSTRIWAAGEAASMQALRKQFFDARGVPRSQASIRGYWKPAASAGD